MPARARPGMLQLAPLLLLLEAAAAMPTTDGDFSALTPTLLWASQPTLANQTMQLWGGALLDASNATVDGAAAKLFDRSATAAKLTLPGDLHPGVYNVCVAASCIQANAPDLFWKRGDVNLSHASTGGWVRIFGRFGDVLRIGSTQLVLTLDGHAPLHLTRKVLSPVNASNNDAWYQIPPTIPVGTYTLALRSRQQDFPTAPPDSTIAIISPDCDWQTQPEAMRVYPVGPCHQGGSPAKCPSLWAALNATRSNGGGVILLAQGTYRFQGESLDLPPFVTLKGVSTALVSLLWDTGAFVDHTDKRMPRYFVGGNGTFAIEDLTINSARFYNNIITDKSGGSRNHRVRRVRIRADCFYRLVENTVARRGGTIANYTYEDVGAAIAFNGQNYQITDNDIYASAHGIYLGHTMPDLKQSAARGIIMRNQINFGMDCYQIDASSNVIFEDNHCVGINLFSRGSAAGSTYGGPAATGIFFARNTEKFVFGGDQEELTTDAGWTNYLGRVQTSVDGKTLTMQGDPQYPIWCNHRDANGTGTDCRYLDSNRTGAAVYVLSGSGAGQMRRIVGGGTTFNRSWEIDQPFGRSGGGVPLDSDSLVSFFERRSHMIIRENTFADGGPCQIFGGLYHAVIAENTAIRSDGFIVEGRLEGWPLSGSIRYPTYLPTFFIELLDNRVLEGNVYGGGTGGFAIRGAFNSTSPYSGSMAAAIVLRNNSGDNSYFSIGDAVSDVVVEENELVNSAEGLQVLNKSTNPTRIYSNRNHHV